MRQPGAGTVRDLYGAAWALALHRDGPALYQLHAGIWEARSDPDALAELDGVRHVALAWDQAARPVLAWERSGAVYVRQWSGDAAGYVTRGPWPGRDPLLLADAPLLGVTGDSDVLLLYLDGAALAYRLQREAYSTARDLAPMPPGAV
ncbi:hypothetical protein IHN32_02195, partial [Deinococcus sp. 14RED07]|uniref:hypothetical protein n=1 Tax=Deinococcus sp. 14RED07 TaxID=2745874 RepID=UPI001E2D66FD